MTSMRYVTITSGVQKILMPIVGLGTWKAPADEVETVILAALESGYRHFDTAFNYNTEASIGEALQKWLQSGKGTRDQLFITTKLPSFGNRASDVTKFLMLSLQKLKLDYIDLYLMHMPFAFKLNEETLSPALNPDGSYQLDKQNDIIETWKVMESQVKSGLVKAIGLSNCNEAQIIRICQNADIKPAVLQVEMHAYFQQTNVLNLCKKLGVAVTAYAPLGSPDSNMHFKTKYNYDFQNFPNILGHPSVIEIAIKLKKSPGQILLKHLIDKNVVVIPKSTNLQRIQANINIFDIELSDEDTKALNELDKGRMGRVFDFLFWKGIEEHPEYPFRGKFQIPHL